tara:strand:+ start:145 stop:408 length:264 start_codon:yes stop_codon:yes gene_type:complete
MKIVANPKSRSILWSFSIVNAESGDANKRSRVAAIKSTRTMGCLTLSKKAFLAIAKVWVNIVSRRVKKRQITAFHVNLPTLERTKLA